MISLFFAAVFISVFIILKQNKNAKIGVKIFLGIIDFLAFALFILMIIPEKSNKVEPVIMDFSGSSYVGNVDPAGLKLHYGELVDLKQNGSTVVVKARFISHLSRQTFINQNFFNIGDLVHKNGFNTCEEIQYWAVYKQGETEYKVISFTVDKSAITALYNDNIVPEQLIDFSKDLWISNGIQ